MEHAGGRILFVMYIPPTLLVVSCERLGNVAGKHVTAC